MGTNSKEGYKVEKELEPEYNREFQKEVLLTEILAKTEKIEEAEADRIERDKNMSKQEKGADEFLRKEAIDYKSILDNALQGYANDSSTAYYKYEKPKNSEGDTG